MRQSTRDLRVAMKSTCSCHGRGQAKGQAAPFISKVASVQLHLSSPMATTNDSSTRRSPSRDDPLSNTTDNVQSNGGVVRAEESPYSTFDVKRQVSAGDLQERVAGANSGASGVSGQSSSAGRRPRQPVVPKTKASESSQPAAYADVEPFVPDRADSVRDTALSSNQSNFDLRLARV